MADTTNTTQNEGTGDAALDAIIAQHGASITGGRVFPERFGAKVLAALSGKVARVIIALPVAAFEDTAMLDAIAKLDGITTLDTLTTLAPSKVKAGNTRSTVKLAAEKVNRKVNLVTLRNANGTPIAVSVTNAVS